MDARSGSELIHNARVHAGLTQGQLAQRIGTTQSAVSRWERGHDEPRLSSLSAILRACGLRLVLRAEVDDVDRSQVRQQLAMSPDERLTSVVNLSEMLSAARAVH